MENNETLDSENKHEGITYDDLFSGLSANGIYSHLQILLHREYTILRPEFGQRFLMVSPNTFGLVKLNDLHLCDNKIFMELEDAFTGVTEPVFIPVNDRTFRFVLIYWEDVVEIINHDVNRIKKMQDLLEFEFPK